MLINAVVAVGSGTARGVFKENFNIALPVEGVPGALSASSSVKSILPVTFWNIPVPLLIVMVPPPLIVPAMGLISGLDHRRSIHP